MVGRRGVVRVGEGCGKSGDSWREGCGKSGRGVKGRVDEGG